MADPGESFGGAQREKKNVLCDAKSDIRHRHDNVSILVAAPAVQV